MKSYMIGCWISRSELLAVITNGRFSLGSGMTGMVVMTAIIERSSVDFEMKKPRIVSSITNWVGFSYIRTSTVQRHGWIPSLLGSSYCALSVHPFRCWMYRSGTSPRTSQILGWFPCCGLLLSGFLIQPIKFTLQQLAKYSPLFSS